MRPPKSKSELVVLGLLHDKPMHGYQIIKVAKTYQMNSWANIMPPTIYMTITKLEMDGMIQTSKVEKEGFMPERKIYRLTQKGKKRLAQLVENSLLDEE